MLMYKEWGKNCTRSVIICLCTRNDETIGKRPVSSASAYCSHGLRTYRCSAEDGLHGMCYPDALGLCVLGAFDNCAQPHAHAHCAPCVRWNSPAHPPVVAPRFAQGVIGTLLQTQGKYLKGCEEEDKTKCGVSQIHDPEGSGSVNTFIAAGLNFVVCAIAVTTVAVTNLSMRATKYRALGGGGDGMAVGLLDSEHEGGGGAIERRDSYTTKEERNADVYGSFQEDRL